MLSQKVKQLYSRVRKPKPRRYIDSRVGVEGFFRTLKEHDIHYVVLRWFEDFPNIKRGEDIDMLVADEDIDRVSALFTGRKRDGIPCDLYSESGLPGTRYRKIAYYPVHLAGHLLRNAVCWKDVYRVPDPRSHLLSMAFHAVYHKGYDSGIPSAFRSSTVKADHDYERWLERLAEACEMRLPEERTLETLDAWLKDQGWRPGLDTLEKLSRKNAWIRDAWFSPEVLAGVEKRIQGLGVFLLRERAVSHVRFVEQRLYDEGFDILHSAPVDPARCAYVTQHTRGGNWKRGPWAVSGGPPAHAIAVLDLCPLAPGQRLLRKHPGLTNLRMYQLKESIRDGINKKASRHDRYNPLHSSDNARQALEYLEIVFPDCRDAIEAKARALYESFQTPYPVLRSLSRGQSRRAKVELIDFHGVPAVCKTFRTGRERFLQREIEAREIGRDLPCMTKILAVGTRHLVMEWIEDCKQDYSRRVPPFGYRLLPAKLLEEAAQIILYFRRRGYEYIDFTPKNLLLTRKGEVRLIDFEYLQKVHAGIDDTRGCYAWYPVPSDFKGDLPSGYLKKGYPYRRWRRDLGLPLFCTRITAPSVVISLLRMALSVYLVQRNLWKRERS